MNENERDSPDANLLNSLFYHLPAQFFIRGSGFVRNVLLARFLGPVEFGLFTMVQMAIVLIEPMAVMGQPSSMVRFGKRLENEGLLGVMLRRKFTSIIISGLVVVPLVIFMVPGMSGLLFGSGTRTDLLAVVAFTAGIMALHHLLYATRMGEGKFRESSILQGSYFLLFTIMAPILAWQYRTAFWAALTSPIAYLVITILGFFSFRKLFMNSRGARGAELSKMSKTMLRYGLMVSITGLVFKLFFYLDRGIILHMEDKEALGIYSGAMLIGVAVFQIGSALGDILMPEVSRLHDTERREEAVALIKLIFKVASLAMTAAASFLLLFREKLIPVLFGGEYVRGKEVLAQLILFQLLYGLHWNLVIYIRLKQRNYLEFVAAVISVPLNFILCYYLAQKMGLAGVGWAVMIAMVVEVGMILAINGFLGFKLGFREWLVCIAPFFLLFDSPVSMACLWIFLLLALTTRILLSGDEKRFIVGQIFRVSRT